MLNDKRIFIDCYYLNELFVGCFAVNLLQNFSFMNTTNTKFNDYNLLTLLFITIINQLRCDYNWIAWRVN